MDGFEDPRVTINESSAHYLHHFAKFEDNRLLVLRQLLHLSQTAQTAKLSSRLKAYLSRYADKMVLPGCLNSREGKTPTR